MRFEAYEITEPLAAMLRKAGRHDLIASGFDVDDAALARSRALTNDHAHAIYHALFDRSARVPEAARVVAPVEPPAATHDAVHDATAAECAAALQRWMQIALLVAILLALCVPRAHAQATRPLAIQLQSGGSTIGTAAGLLKLNCSTATYLGQVYKCTTARGIPFTIGDPGASAALSAAATTTDYVTVPFACTISAYNLIVDAGTITVAFWKVATGTAIPTSGNSISTSGVGIATGTAIHSTTVTDFTTTAVAANDILAMNVTAVATAKYVQGVLECDQ